jgi:hypothetical protein
MAELGRDDFAAYPSDDYCSDGCLPGGCGRRGIETAHGFQWVRWGYTVSRPYPQDSLYFPKKYQLAILSIDLAQVVDDPAPFCFIGDIVALSLCVDCKGI